MKKILNWLKSPKSDFILFIGFLVLLNIVCHKAFVRIDLTEPKSYSLSKVSKSMVKNLETPLSVRVFFDDNLPSPYNSVSQYVKDILTEYKGSANKNFSVSFMDMSNNENTELARDLGLQQVQIQEIKNNEVGLKQVYMGLVITYGDNIEVVSPITSTEGFEYNLTSKITKMISMADTLAGLKNGEKIQLKLIQSSVLNTFGISGADQIASYVKNAYETVNKQNMDRIEYQVIDPSSAEAEELSKKYGIQMIQYHDKSGSVEKAALGLILENGDNFYSIPLEIQNSFFGYMITGLDGLDTVISEGLQSLLSNVTDIGYITGHGEKSITDENESLYFNNLVSGMYKLVEIDLNSQDIPTGMNSIIINGPTNDFTEEELYKVDQFVMRGGNVLFFVDGVVDDGMSQYTGQQGYVSNEVNISRLLDKYGVKCENNLVFDKNCYVNNSTQYGTLNYYWAPMLSKDSLAKKNPITNNLGYVIMFQNSAIDVTSAQADGNSKVTVLAKTSSDAWSMKDNISLNPLYMSVPSDKSQLAAYNLAVMIEGKFDSAFEQAPVVEQRDEDGNVIEMPSGNLQTNKHISSSVMPGKVFVIGSSYVTTRYVIDENGTTPLAYFLMNVVDYMNGNEDMCTMRTKSLSVNALSIKNTGAANFWKYFEQYGLVVILIIVGLIVWRGRTKRRAAINKKYNPNDTRTITK